MVPSRVLVENPDRQPDAAPPDHVATSLKSAAAATRLLGVIEIALFCILAGLVWRASSWTPAQLQEFFGAERITYDHAVTLQSLVVPAAASLVALGVLPGVAYVLASVRIARGSYGGITLAMILAMMQFIVLGSLLLRQAGAAFAAGDPPSLSANVLALGTPMAGLLFVLRLLVLGRMAMQARGVARFITEARREINS